MTLAAELRSHTFAHGYYFKQREHIGKFADLCQERLNDAKSLLGKVDWSRDLVMSVLINLAVWVSWTRDEDDPEDMKLKGEYLRAEKILKEVLVRIQLLHRTPKCVEYNVGAGLCNLYPDEELSDLREAFQAPPEALVSVMMADRRSPEEKATSKNTLKTSVVCGTVMLSTVGSGLTGGAGVGAVGMGVGAVASFVAGPLLLTGAAFVTARWFFADRELGLGKEHSLELLLALAVSCMVAE